MTRVLVAAATRHGATYELAEAIGSVIAAHGLSVDVRHLDEVANASDYDALVLGSAVYMGRWTKEAQAFLERHERVVATRPTWLFSSGPINGTGELDAEALVEATGARAHHLFGGRLVRGVLGRRERLVVGALRAPEGDYRDWATVTAWATAIARTIADEVAA
jgi:menaquinone-dependent protoporphyrinogen oxidase